MTSAPVRMSPADVAERLFGVDMWATPREILSSVFRPRSRVAVKACHSSSKTHTAAIVVLLSLYEGADVVTTAPTWVQVKNLLWMDGVHRLLRESIIPLAEWGSVNQTEIAMPDGSHAIGLSTNEGVNFQGWHARPGSFLQLIGDEAPGVLPSIFESWEGISAGGDVRWLLLGNPVISSGYFFDIFAGDSPLWRRYTIDAFDTPNLAGLTVADLLALPDHELDNNPRPYLATRRWVRDRYFEWGEDHPLWQSRVRGNFPLQADDALLSLAWLEAASRRGVVHDPEQAVQAGIDVAGPGDDETVLCVRQGDAILALHSWTLADSRGAVIDALRPWADQRLDAVNVDTAGIGHYYALALKDAGLPVRHVNVGEAATTDRLKERFVNLRAQMFWALRERVAEAHFAGLADQKALAQLAGIRYAHDSRGRVAIEKKDDARKRGVKSPDRAEAVALAFWSGNAVSFDIAKQPLTLEFKTGAKNAQAEALDRLAKLLGGAPQAAGKVVSR